LTPLPIASIICLLGKLKGYSRVCNNRVFIKQIAKFAKLLRWSHGFSYVAFVCFKNGLCVCIVQFTHCNIFFCWFGKLVFSSKSLWLGHMITKLDNQVQYN